MWLAAPTHPPTPRLSLSSHLFFAVAPRKIRPAFNAAFLRRGGAPATRPGLPVTKRAGPTLCEPGAAAAPARPHNARKPQPPHTPSSHHGRLPNLG